MMFTPGQQQHIDQLVERRLLRERQIFEHRMRALQDRHASDLAALQAEIVRLKSERDTAQRLADKWFRSPETRSTQQT